MSKINTIPKLFQTLLVQGVICEQDIEASDDGFYAVKKSLCDIFKEKGIEKFPDSQDQLLDADKFFDDWYLYAVSGNKGFVYSLFKLREQENDLLGDTPADGDTPGVTISFISFTTCVLLDCLKDASYQNRKAINKEINRVVAFKKQCHDKALKQYFLNPSSCGAYIVATLYVKHILTFVKDGFVAVPYCYEEIFKQSLANKNSAKLSRLPRFIDALNKKAGATVCDHKKIYVKDFENPTLFEALAILATHTGNASFHSFAAEVEYHARFLTPPARIRIPFFKKSIYDSAVRADMTIDDTEFEGPAPFYRLDSRLVKRQERCHSEYQKI